MYILLIADKKNLLIFDRNKLFFTLGHTDMLTIKQVFHKEGITNGLFLLLLSTVYVSFPQNI